MGEKLQKRKSFWHAIIKFFVKDYQITLEQQNKIAQLLAESETIQILNLQV